MPESHTLKLARQRKRDAGPDRRAQKGAVQQKPVAGRRPEQKILSQRLREPTQEAESSGLQVLRKCREQGQERRKVSKVFQVTETRPRTDDPR